MRPFYTAGEIAREIMQPGDDSVVLLNAVRNWAKLQHLRPTGEQHPGAGKACLFSSAELVRARKIKLLVDTFRMSAVDAVRFIDAH